MKIKSIKQIATDLKMKPLGTQAGDDPSVTVVREHVRFSYYPHLSDGTFVFDALGKNVGIFYGVNDDPYRVEKVLLLLAYYGFDQEGMKVVRPEFGHYRVNGVPVK